MMVQTAVVAQFAYGDAYLDLNHQPLGQTVHFPHGGFLHENTRHIASSCYWLAMAFCAHLMEREPFSYTNKGLAEKHHAWASVSGGATMNTENDPSIGALQLENRTPIFMMARQIPPNADDWRRVCQRTVGKPLPFIDKVISTREGEHPVLEQILQGYYDAGGHTVSIRQLQAEAGDCDRGGAPRSRVLPRWRLLRNATWVLICGPVGWSK